MECSGGSDTRGMQRLLNTSTTAKVPMHHGRRVRTSVGHAAAPGPHCCHPTACITTSGSIRTGKQQQQQQKLGQERRQTTAAHPAARSSRRRPRKLAAAADRLPPARCRGSAPPEPLRCRARRPLEPRSSEAGRRPPAAQGGAAGNAACPSKLQLTLKGNRDA